MDVGRFNNHIVMSKILTERSRCCAILICSICFLFQMTSECSAQPETSNNLAVSVPNNFAMSLFIAMWEIIGKLYHKKRAFALRWVLSEEKVLKIFLANTTDFEPKNLVDL